MVYKFHTHFKSSLGNWSKQIPECPKCHKTTTNWPTVKLSQLRTVLALTLITQVNLILSVPGSQTRLALVGIWMGDSREVQDTYGGAGNGKSHLDLSSPVKLYRVTIIQM